MLANWLRGGLEMDRKGEWRLKPQVADTLQRDVQAIMTQTGWQRTLSRSAADQTTMGTTVGLESGERYLPQIVKPRATAPELARARRGPAQATSKGRQQPVGSVAI
jgi:conjugal transfer mating pair stabilization protein TraG